MGWFAPKGGNHPYTPSAARRGGTACWVGVGAPVGVDHPPRHVEPFHQDTPPAFARRDNLFERSYGSRRIKQNRPWMPADSWKFDLLSNHAVESFWDALWLGIRPLLCFNREYRRSAHACPQIHGNSTCYRSMPSRASGTPCGSVFGHFCVL